MFAKTYKGWQQLPVSKKDSERFVKKQKELRQFIKEACERLERDFKSKKLSNNSLDDLDVIPLEDSASQE